MIRCFCRTKEQDDLPRQIGPTERDFFDSVTRTTIHKKYALIICRKSGTWGLSFSSINDWFKKN